MSREPIRFSANEIISLQQEVCSVIRVSAPWKRKYLELQIALMPELAENFRSVRSEISPSGSIRRLTSLVRFSDPLLDKLITNQGPRPPAQAVIANDPLAPLILFQ